MLIGICGAKCAGKSTVAQYLIEHHGFKKLHIDPSISTVENGESGDSEPSSSGPKSSQRPASALSLPLHKKPAPSPHTFSTASALLAFVTKRWQSRWVTTDIPDEQTLDVFSLRPFFILISVDAPLIVRWQRHQSRDSASGATTIGLEEFVAESDMHLYSPTSGMLPLISRATIRLLNTSSSLAHLYATLGKLDLTNPDRLRPGWDSYFMALASLAAQRCNCMKRAVGCVLVGPSRRVVSTGYNGTPRNLVNCADGGCPRCNSGEGRGVGLSTCVCLHAEENALLEAGRDRIREGSVLYCNTCPCLTCSVKIVQVGISEVVYSQEYSMDRDTAEIFRNGGVKLRQFSPPAHGLIHLEKLELY